MKKLLHERLRDFVSNDSVGSYFELRDACNEELSTAFKDLAQFIADEIERYYIPRPRFEDGEPVQFGDSVIGEQVTWMVKSGADVVGQNIEERQGSVEGYECDEDGGTWLRITDDYGELFSVRPPEGADYFKRPSPKVLDADGVEINVGDTVWEISSGLRFDVAEVVSEHCVRTVQGDAFVHPDKSLTHKEPDSLEKLRYEMLNAYDKYSIVGDSMVKGWADRLSALIEKAES